MNNDPLYTITRKECESMQGIFQIFTSASQNDILRLVVIMIVLDTFFGVLRAIKERKFNSNFGINGAIRKVGMLVSLIFLVIIDSIVSVNLIGFIPEKARIYLNLTKVGTAEFFGILFLAYETVSILKNASLCGLPVKKIWKTIKNVLGKYTDELPDADELEEVKATDAVE